MGQTGLVGYSYDAAAQHMGKIMHFATIKLLWSMLELKHRRQLAFLGGLMLISSFMELLSVAAVPGFVMAISQADQLLHNPTLKNYLELLSVNSTKELAISAGIGLVLMFFIRGIVFIFMVWKQSSTISEVSQNLSQRLFSQYLAAPLEQFSNRNTAKYGQIIFSEVERVTSGFLLPILAIVMNITVSLSLVFLILIVNPLSALGVGLVTAATAYLFMKFSRRRVSWHGNEVSNRSRMLQQAMNEGLGSIKHVRLRGAEHEFIRAFDENLEGKRRSARALFFSASLSKPVFETTAIVALVLLTFTLIIQGHTLTSIVPTLALIGAIAVRMLPTLNHMSQMLVALNSNESAVVTLSREFDQYRERPNFRLAADLPLQGDIVLENVSFRFSSSEANVIENLSLSIPQNSSVAFVGPTGSGKSTLVDIILGLLPPCDGMVSVNGQNIATNLPGWQRRIGYIPQSIYLTDTSIRHNVALGVPKDEIDDAAVWHALELAQMADIIRKNPQGLDATVGEQGARMSGGQRQRIGIARALYYNPSVLVLDEATAALDNATEANIMSAIESARFGRTLIMIAHRLSTIRNCDIIYFIESGVIKSSGGFEELIKSNSHFAKLAKGI